MLESEILKFICANQGAVNTDDLVFNVCCGDSTSLSEIICNQDKFALCCRNGQPKVVARTKLKLCWPRDCQGTCGKLHLCKNFLFSGSCAFSLLRRGCNFSHELNSDHNNVILRKHDLENLSRTELCTLLLQSDNTLLPPICHDYNNGDGEFGRCQNGDGCKRLHICEGYLNGDCSCPKTHDFWAPQPLKSLKEKGVPDNLVFTLKAVYTNKETLWVSGNRGGRGNKGNHQKQQLNLSTSDASANAAFTFVSSDSGLILTQEWYRGRGGQQGNRGKRGKRGGRRKKENQGNLLSGQSCSTCDIHSAVDSSSSDSDTSSDDGQNRKQTQKPNRTSAAATGRGGNQGNWGNHQQLKKGRSTNDISDLLSNKHANSNDGPNRRQRQRPVRDKTEICMYFIKGSCKHEDKCFKAHDKMPYRWQVKQGDQWNALPDNETIEKDYCDPKNTYSSSTPPVYFDTMTSGLNQVRRLSTVNSLVEPTFIHTTEWVWYWEDEFGKWNMYTSSTSGHKAADIGSAQLEQKFLDNDKDVVEFTAGSQSYSLSFQDMIQTNKHYGTKRLVRRRPQFVSAADVKTKRVRRPMGQPNFCTIPDHWDKSQIPETGCKRVFLQPSSDEYKEIEALFRQTMRGFDIIRMERIQNKALWEVFQWQKNLMKNKNSGRNATEKRLFHGTDSNHVDAICLTNFDWRICGTHGTAFGKGSYFARDANYSHSYTGDSDVKSMFVSQVLVGDFTRGSSHYCRPPSKDGGDVNFYDSCVDDVINPSIFVVFEKHQIYPEYLLQYKTLHPLVALYGASSAPAPKPVAAPRPVTRPGRLTAQHSATVRQRATVSHQPSLSVYQPSTPSYQPTTPVQPTTTVQRSTPVQPSTPSYQPSTPVQPTTTVQRSTPSYQPTTPVQPTTTVQRSTPVQPSTPSYQPTTPVQPTTTVQRSTSSYQPSTPVQPTTPSYQPSSFYYQASTGTYNYQPIRTSNQPKQSSASSSPSPKAKKSSDTCVIA
ncbi:protein mono-ADP-ribosyltransferase PARP12 [Toxotes jaculatrix]|uniref:protein mono-ADP-ribosyltransferase PARP12 n=1 Tax=Toxotes jaculatrix TaxID=941984 RepID=UPI001B3ADDB5|nr:protein mono-ADP-ribosyltransferase PARP12 [Toxotes jaculatrix]